MTELESIRHLALGCCVVSTAAGLLRVFWPDNGYKPVINAVLMLYIITAVWQFARTADWQGVAGQLQNFSAAAKTDYEPYAQSLAEQVSAQAVREILQQNGIEAAVSLRDGTLYVTHARPADAPRVRQLLQENCGSLPYTVQGGGDAP